MTTAISLLVVGLLLGIRHASDPDHVVAVSTIVSRERSLLGAVGIGALWGLGHTATVFAIGTAIVLFKLAITPRIGLAMEFCVALMLIVLGVQNLRAARTGAAAPAPARLRPLAVGMVHGLAGSAAVTLAVIALIPEPLWALACLAVFGFGTMLGMALITLAIAVPSVYAAGRVDRIERGLRLATGVASVGFGLFLAHQIGVVDGLFSDSPRWEPK
jgi:high-affinity nickel-transport protein